MSAPAIPTSPKKRHLMPSGKLRKALRSHGHALSVIVQVGKAGVTASLVKQLEQALADHELVKVKVAADGPADRFAVAEQLAALAGVNIVQIVGGIILLYKRHPRVARYEGKRALPTTADETATKATGKSGKMSGAKGRKKTTGKAAKKVGKKAAAKSEAESGATEA